MPPVTLLFDMRAPDFGAALPELYTAACEMAGFADCAGFDRIWIAEHHGADDNYIPTPFVLAAAFAARTTKLRICVNAVVLPFHDPVEVAEQIGVLDLISNGRLEVVFAAGYVPSEFKRFGVPLNKRGRLLDEGIGLILRALAGERFEVGEREIYVRPLPLQHPSTMLYVGGGVDASAQRAARYGLGFVPMRRNLIALYDAECRKLGREPGPKIGPYGPILIHVANDPEKAKAILEPHILHHAATYARWAAESGTGTSNYTGMEDPEVVWASGRYRVLTPDACVVLAAEVDAIGASLVLQPLIAGLSPKLGWESLELFASAVLPQLNRQNLGA